jgi:CRISPR-associated protein Csb2
MSSFFCVTVRFLQSTCHARAEQGEPEWPPSPLRVFQSLTAAAAARWNERERIEHGAPALRWLEKQPPPLIIAPRAKPSGVKYRLYVPDNVGDKVAGSWSRGGEASIADYRTEKDVRPTHVPDDAGDLHYLWPCSGPQHDADRHTSVLVGAARSMTHLGWGVDMVAGNACLLTDAETSKLVGERWHPTGDEAGTALRVPVAGTLSALMDKHEAFLNRLRPDGFQPVPPLSLYDAVGYRRSSDPGQLDFAALSLLRPDASGFRIFDAARGGIIVAAMLRHAASSTEIAGALGWSHEKVGAFILGHGESAGEPHRPVNGPRLAFVLLPSIEHRGEDSAEVIGSIRRALIVVVTGRAGDDLKRLTRLLSGAELTMEGQSGPAVLLSQIPRSDNMVRRYTRPAPTWATVTPMILPGYDDPRKLRKKLSAKLPPEAQRPGEMSQSQLVAKLDRRIDYLIRKAIRQAGYSDELARDAEIDWRPVSFWPGADHAANYRVPDKLRRYRRLHVKLTWRNLLGEGIALQGPLCLGGGRFLGLGLFAPIR